MADTDICQQLVYCNRHSIIASKKGTNIYNDRFSSGSDEVKRQCVTLGDPFGRNSTASVNQSKNRTQSETGMLIGLHTDVDITDDALVQSGDERRGLIGHVRQKT